MAGRSGARHRHATHWRVAHWLPLILLLACFCWHGAVAAAQENVRSIQYIETSGPLASDPDYVAQVIILDGNLVWRNAIVRPKGDMTNNNSSDPDSPGSYEIHDVKAGKRVFIDPDKRQFVLIKGTRRCLGPGQYRTEPIEPNPTANFDGFFGQPIPTDKATTLPERFVDGKRAVGYVLDDSDISAVRTTTYWVDRTTHLPVRIEARFQPTGLNQEGAESIRRNIVFDAPVDRSLFSTDPPAGYSTLADREY